MLITARLIRVARLVAVGSAIAATSTNDTGGSAGEGASEAAPIVQIPKETRAPNRGKAAHAPSAQP